jgi:ribosome-associated protein
MLAHAVFHELKTRTREVAPGVSPSVEGSDDSTPEWLVVDAGSIVVHVFHEDHRSEYDLETLWGGDDSSNVTRVAMPQTRLTRETIQ